VFQIPLKDDVKINFKKIGAKITRVHRISFLCLCLTLVVVFDRRKKVSVRKMIRLTLLVDIFVSDVIFFSILRLTTNNMALIGTLFQKNDTNCNFKRQLLSMTALNVCNFWVGFVSVV